MTDQPAEILFIEEILQQHAASFGKRVRVLGRVSSYQPGVGQLEMTDNGHTLRVSVKLVAQDVVAYPKQLWHFIGELEQHEDGGLVLAARFGAHLETLQLDQFKAALQMRRQHLEETAALEEAHAAVADMDDDDDDE
eukprot:TRINITY_DN2823_c0_g1_i2.p1 TRINITY_DN2823_c0_g1~~TRINITY_DN2823_c0_g1_i2.p1  ORF type:complete len:137 (+),score=40.05 TRINITY_DN2823_c0_g1_i2:410-820(+)